MYSAGQVDLFFKNLAETGSIPKSSEASGIAYSTSYTISKKYPERTAEAKQQFLDKLETKFVDFALNGIWEETTFQGSVVDKRRKISAQLLVKLMESKHPEYKQRQAIEHSGSVEFEDKTDDELLEELKRLNSEVGADE